jgi:hypothetical protein
VPVLTTTATESDPDVVARLGEAAVARGVEDRVLAALDGDSALDAALRVTSPSRSAVVREHLVGEVGIAPVPVGAYLSAVRVTHFRGVGPKGDALALAGTGAHGRRGSQRPRHGSPPLTRSAATSPGTRTVRADVTYPTGTAQTVRATFTVR